jgi:hypothetical protein
MAKSYGWETEREREQASFLETLVKVFKRYTKGRMEIRCIGWQPREEGGSSSRKPAEKLLFRRTRLIHLDCSCSLQNSARLLPVRGVPRTTSCLPPSLPLPPNPLYPHPPDPLKLNKPLLWALPPRPPPLALALSSPRPNNRPRPTTTAPNINRRHPLLPHRYRNSVDLPTRRSNRQE